MDSGEEEDDDDEKKRRRGPILRAGGLKERKDGKRKSQWEIYPTYLPTRTYLPGKINT